MKALRYGEGEKGMDKEMDMEELSGWKEMQECANEVSSFLERYNNDEGRLFVRLRPDAPDWVRKLLTDCAKCTIDDDWGLWAADCCLDAIIGNTHYKDVLVDAMSASDAYAGAPQNWVNEHLERHGRVAKALARSESTLKEVVLRIQESMLMEIAMAFMSSLSDRRIQKKSASSRSDQTPS